MSNDYEPNDLSVKDAENLSLGRINRGLPELINDTNEHIGQWAYLDCYGGAAFTTLEGESGGGVTNNLNGLAFDPNGAVYGNITKIHLSGGFVLAYPRR